MTARYIENIYVERFRLDICVWSALFLRNYHYIIVSSDVVCCRVKPAPGETHVAPVSFLQCPTRVRTSRGAYLHLCIYVCVALQANCSYLVNMKHSFLLLIFVLVT